MDKQIIGFKITSLTDIGKHAIKKNSKIPVFVKPLIDTNFFEGDPHVFTLKFKDKIIKSQDGQLRKLVVKSQESLIENLDKEMTKKGAKKHEDYVIEVLYNE